MSKIRLKKKQVKHCETCDGNKTNVLELIFNKSGKDLRVLIKDLENDKIDNLIKQAKTKAKEYFLKVNNGNKKG